MDHPSGVELALALAGVFVLPGLAAAAVVRVAGPGLATYTWMALTGLGFAVVWYVYVRPMDFGGVRRGEGP